MAVDSQGNKKFDDSGRVYVDALRLDFTEEALRDYEFEEANSEARREHWQKVRAELDKERSAKREAMPLDQRLQRLFADLSLISDDVKGWSYQDGFAYHKSGTIDRHVSAILEAIASGSPQAKAICLAHIRALEEVVDSHTHRSTAKPGERIELAVEKDRRIISDYAGLPPEIVSQLDPSLGSPKVIRNVRRLEGLNIETGYEKVPIEKL